MKVQFRVVAGVAALSLALTACAGAKEKKAAQQPSANPSASAAAMAIPASDLKPTPRDQVADGGTMTWPISSMPEQWNPSHFDGWTGDLNDLLGGTVSHPFLFNDKAEPTMDKDFVLDAKLETTPKQKVTYTLNPKAVWSDGKPITAADYIGMWKAQNGTNEKFRPVSTTGYELMDSVTQGKDEFEVVTTYKSPYPDWKGAFDFLVPAALTKDPDAFDNLWKEKPLVSAGPFVLDKIDKTDKTATFIRNPKWWGEPAKLDKIVYRALDLTAQAGAFANGEIDWFTIGSDVANYEKAKTVADADIRKANTPDYRHFTFSTVSDLFKDLKVRQAIALAINREAVAKADLNGLDWPIQTVGNHIFLNTQTGYQDNSAEWGAYQPDKAKTMLDEAGWKLAQGDKFRKKDGKELTIDFMIPAGVANSKQEAEITQTMLAEVGAKVTIDTVPLDKFFTDYVNTGKFDITAFRWGGTPFPVSSSLSIFRTPEKDNIRQNYGRGGSADIDKLLLSASTEFDPAKAAGLVSQADKLIWEQVMTFPLYQYPGAVAVKKKLVNFGSFGFANYDYINIGFTK